MTDRAWREANSEAADNSNTDLKFAAIMQVGTSEHENSAQTDVESKINSFDSSSYSLPQMDLSADTPNSSESLIDTNAVSAAAGEKSGSHQEQVGETTVVKNDKGEVIAFKDAGQILEKHDDGTWWVGAEGHPHFYKVQPDSIAQNQATGVITYRLIPSNIFEKWSGVGGFDRKLGHSYLWTLS